MSPNFWPLNFLSFHIRDIFFGLQYTCFLLQLCHNSGQSSDSPKEIRCSSPLIGQLATVQKYQQQDQTNRSVWYLEITEIEVIAQIHGAPESGCPGYCKEAQEVDHCNKTTCSGSWFSDRYSILYIQDLTTNYWTWSPDESGWQIVLVCVAKFLLPWRRPHLSYWWADRSRTLCHHHVICHIKEK